MDLNAHLDCLCCRCDERRDFDENSIPGLKKHQDGEIQKDRMESGIENNKEDEVKEDEMKDDKEDEIKDDD